VMLPDEVKQCLAGMTRRYMDRIVDGIRNETIDVECIEVVWEGCEALLRTTANHEESAWRLAGLNGPWLWN
jgi:hypothetical protein